MFALRQLSWESPLLDQQDRVPRRSESFLKEFRPLKLGTNRLERGRGLLTLRALTVPHVQVMDLRQVNLPLK